ncbi:hypothetical protein [Salipiger abyssi]|uniref:hypothetical protein n=1 Tax=Salipiger abyssi TaxID=1250539 RepID=UPI004059B5F1
MDGSKLYQRRAKEALPLLVRQAFAAKPIFYSDLAVELEIPNPRTLNFPLGAIGNSLDELSQDWGQPIPPIQCLVINKSNGVPGEGIGWFLEQGSIAGLSEGDFKELSLPERRKVVEVELQRIYAYNHWLEVLKEFDLPVPAPTISQGSMAAFGGGEGEQHKTLKEYVQINPRIVGHQDIGDTESLLLSGDRLDVSFRDARRWTGVEVKSAISGELDLQRGIFQCVKYKAVMEAMLLASGASMSCTVDVVLVLEGQLPASLTPLRNQLGVQVLEGVVPS